MVSRRRILSRSRDDLHLDNFPEEEDDVWHMKEKLYKVREKTPSNCSSIGSDSNCLQFIIKSVCVRSSFFSRRCRCQALAAK